jgi:hypothetical protein
MGFGRICAKTLRTLDFVRMGQTPERGTATPTKEALIGLTNHWQRNGQSSEFALYVDSVTN